MRIKALTVVMMFVLAVGQAHALSSDRNQPATIEADEVEFDFRSGERTYTGNVVVVQGTLRITGDKMVVQYNQDGDQIEQATTWGDPATFKQRPDGKENDVYGEGQTIIMDQIKNTLTLIEDAEMTQGGNTANGREIVYDMSSDKMTVKGFRQAGGDEEGSEEEAGDSDTGRARVTINPDGSSEQGAAGDDSQADETDETDEAGDEDAAAGDSDETSTSGSGDGQTAE